jgi:hypothetical protein
MHTAVMHYIITVVQYIIATWSMGSATLRRTMRMGASDDPKLNSNDAPIPSNLMSAFTSTPERQVSMPRRQNTNMNESHFSEAKAPSCTCCPTPLLDPPQTSHQQVPGATDFLWSVK